MCYTLLNKVSPRELLLSSDFYNALLFEWHVLYFPICLFYCVILKLTLSISCLNLTLIVCHLCEIWVV